MKINRQLSEKLFTIMTGDELDRWIREVEKDIGGVIWNPLGGRDNNSHTVEVATDPALALVERPTNCIDAMLDLKAETLGETAETPHAAAAKWFNVPADGLSGLSEEARRQLADNIQVSMLESGDSDRPTIAIEDKGVGQHPDDFLRTLLSIDGSTKLSKRHLMGVYNAGGSASYKFATRAVIVSRRAPNLLNGRADEIGVSIVKYEEPPNRKIGRYVYLAARDGSIPRLDLTEIPDVGHGTHVKLLDYQLKGYAGRADLPTGSLWQLFHSALPEPALPIRIIERRVPRFKKTEKRVVNGLLHLLRSDAVSEYSDSRDIDLGADIGSVKLHYFVVKESAGTDYYVRADQGLTIALNGQRQISKPRQWLKTELELFFLFKRLIVVVDGTGLTAAARRQVFTSTREAGVNSPTTQTILDRVVGELKEDDELYELEELAKQKTKEDATKSTTEKVKRQLSSQIGAYLQGKDIGAKGGGEQPKKKKKAKGRRRGKKKGVKRNLDDSMLPEVPTELVIDSNPLKIEQGGTSPLRLSINAKNGFLPKYTESLKIVFGGDLNARASITSTGRLLGGKVRLTVSTVADVPLGSFAVKAALVVPELGVLLTADGVIDVATPEEPPKDADKVGGDLNIDIQWVGREKWDQMGGWDAETVGDCRIYREDANDRNAITKVEWYLNKAFTPFERVVEAKNLTERTMKSFQENYEYPVCFGLFKQALAEADRERSPDEDGKPVEIPDDYVKGEQARLARAVLMAMEPDMQIVGASET
jgi:hypothetical protein